MSKKTHNLSKQKQQDQLAKQLLKGEKSGFVEQVDRKKFMRYIHGKYSGLLNIGE